MFVLDISDKANPKKVSSGPTRALYRIHAHRGAAVRPRADVMTDEATENKPQGLAG